MSTPGMGMPPKTMARGWSEFFARHGERYYTPAFNSFLESLIANPGAPLSLRVVAWLLRLSWGNRSDSPVNADGVAQYQTDCARDLGLFREVLKDGRKELEPDRRKVNPVFLDLEAHRYIRYEGRSIILEDDPPSSFAKPSPERPPNPSNGEEEEKNDPYHSFDAYLEQFIAPQHASAYKAYQKAAEQVKEFRTEYLPAWKAFRAERQKSERARQDEAAERPKGSDDAAERVRQTRGKGATNGNASYMRTENGECMHAGRLAKLHEIFPHEFLADSDLDALDQWLTEQLSDLHLPESFVAFVKNRASKGRIRAGLVFDREKLPRDYCEWVSRRSQPTTPRDAETQGVSLEEEIASLEFFIQELPNHPQTPAYLERLEALRAQKAGQR